ncbi:acyl carrier protein [Providencia stuartii]|uniref:Acyl carrier protein n=1 Tax=Providencia stuartii TaxID=588 RepID=A0A1S1HWK5_PROST|nr:MULTISPECIES: acyl carrier protein [Providencia]MDV5226819.1 acyl carrier protein [Providencia rettgeri]ELR5112148.1 acyl carrier protein [Providencia stuartii]ELR5299616.1 acyl carrier protein [Providencia stuartii]MDW7588613.1 acyl carrier protein [Providencia sp. 2023EL-00965]OHT25746.1 hypothetical protein A3Q29_12160 [Providencia stuartii]
MSDILIKVRTLIHQDILKGSHESLSDDFNLIESGILSSLSIVRIVAFIEDTFDIDVGISDPRKYFISINKITDYIENKLLER